MDNLRVYRNTLLAETMLYCYYTLRETMLGGLVSLAESQLAAARPDSDDAYEELEATLFTIHAIHEAVSLPCPLYLPTLFGPTVLGAIPRTQHISLRSTALRLVGAYATWFVTEPEACLAAVGFVVGGLEEKELGSQAARALRGLCGANRKVLTGHVGSFVAVLGGLEGKVEVSDRPTFERSHSLTLVFCDRILSSSGYSSQSLVLCKRCQRIRSWSLCW